MLYIAVVLCTIRINALLHGCLFYAICSAVVKRTFTWTKFSCKVALISFTVWLMKVDSTILDIYFLITEDFVPIIFLFYSYSYTLVNT